MRLLSFGEIVWDIFGENKCLGGAPLNFAAFIAMLGENSHLISAVGNDVLGQSAIEKLKKFGVNTEYVSLLHGKETGKCLVSLDENAVPDCKIMDDVAYDYIQMPSLKEKTDVIAFGTLALRNESNKSILTQILQTYSFSEVFADLNIRKPFYSKESILFCLEIATIVKISNEEMPVIAETVSEESASAEDFVLALCEKFGQIQLVIITSGEKGAFCYNRKENKFYYCEAHPTSVVSTVGAGDSFGAAFLIKFFENRNCRESLEYASKISSIVCSRQEAISEEIFKLIKNVVPY